MNATVNRGVMVVLCVAVLLMFTRQSSVAWSAKRSRTPRSVSATTPMPSHPQVLDAPWRLCDSPDPLLARYECAWRWTSDPVEEIRAWEREYAYLYAVEFAVNSVSDVTQERLAGPQRRLTRQLDKVEVRDSNHSVPPFPVLVTTTDYTDMVHAPAFDVAFRGQHQGIADTVAAVDMSSGMLIDTCNRGSGFGFGTKVAHSGDAFVDNYEFVLKRDLLGHDNSVTYRVLNDTSGYFWGMDWYPNYPGHMVDDVLYHFASHWTTGSTSRTLLMLHSDAPILKAFVHLVTQHYTGVKVQLVDENVVYHAFNVRFGAVQDTGYTPHVYRFLAKLIVPSVTAKYAALNVPSFKKLIMVKATTEGGSGSTMKLSPRFRTLAAEHNFSITPPVHLTVEHRTFLVNQAELVMYSWGGTMAVQAYHYANLDRPLRMILLVPGGDHGYIEEGYKVGNIAGGRLNIQKWYEAGENLHHYMQPHTNIKVRALPSADMDDLTADDLVFHDGAFELLHPDDKAFFDRGWSEQTKAHEVATRRRLVYNRLLQSTPEERRESRRVVQQELQRLLGPHRELPRLFVDHFDLSSNYFISRDDYVASSSSSSVDVSLLVWNKVTPHQNVLTLGLRGDRKQGFDVEPRLSAWTGLEADVGRTAVVEGDLRDGVSDFLSRLSHAVNQTARVPTVFWLVPPRLSAHMSELTQFFLAALGHHLMHGRTFTGATLVVPKLPTDVHGIIADLALLVNATLFILPDGEVVAMRAAHVFVGPLLSAPWLQVTAGGHMMAAFLRGGPLSLLPSPPSRRAACFLSDSSLLDDSGLRDALERRKIARHVALSPRDALEVVNNVNTLILPYGPAVQYYLSFWGGTRRILKLVILCPPWAHFHCATGPTCQGPRWFYSRGQAFGARNIEVRYVLTGDQFDREEDEVFDFHGIPSAASLKTTTWQEQRPQDVDRLRHAFQQVKGNSSRAV